MVSEAAKVRCSTPLRSFTADQMAKDKKEEA
jgi:hypothetical protein